MKPLPPSPASRFAFTLVELLVVISIIIILAGLLFPAFGAVQERAKKLQATNDEQSIVNAVKNYFTEYGIYPGPSDSSGNRPSGDFVFAGQYTAGGKAYGITSDYSNDQLINVLRGQRHRPDGKALGTNSSTSVSGEYPLNQRQVVFLEARNAKDAKSPKAGIINDNDSSSPGGAKPPMWVDPWGSPYIVFIDGDYDGRIDTGKFSGVYTAGTNDSLVATGSVAAASLGKDLKAGSNGDRNYVGSDDVVSWR